MSKMVQFVPDSNYHGAFRRHYGACAVTPDRDSDLVTVTEGP